MRLRAALACVAVALGFLVCQPSLADIVIDPANILVAVDQTIREYTMTGSLVQTIPVPYPVSPRPGTEWLKDVVMVDSDHMAVFNGTFSPYLSVLELSTGSWSHQTLAGWTMGNSQDLSGMGAYRSRVFVTDGSTVGGEPRGTIVFDMDAGTANRFEDRKGTHDVNVGLDGKLYLYGEDWGDPDVLHIYDPQSLTYERTIRFPEYFTARGVAANRDGEIYLTRGGEVMKISPTGQLLDVYPFPNFFPSDIDIAPDGRVIVATPYNGVYITDESFTEFTNISGFFDARVGFAFAVPEPSSLALLVAAATWLVGVRGRRADRS